MNLRASDGLVGSIPMRFRPNPASPAPMDSRCGATSEPLEVVSESLADDPASAAQLPLTADERQKLDQRLRAHREDPAAARPWAEVRAAILARR